MPARLQRSLESQHVSRQTLFNPGLPSACLSHPPPPSNSPQLIAPQDHASQQIAGHPAPFPTPGACRETFQAQGRSSQTATAEVQGSCMQDRGCAAIGNPQQMNKTSSPHPTPTPIPKAPALVAADDGYASEGLLSLLLLLLGRHGCCEAAAEAHTARGLGWLWACRQGEHS
jgi:hypothetical protein